MIKKPKKERFNWVNNKIFLSFYGVLLFLILFTVLILINLSTQVEDIEEQLRYTLPKVLDSPHNAKALAYIHTVYVPIYSHIYTKSGKPQLLEATLSIRNTDQRLPISINRIEYFGSDGASLKKYLNKPVTIGPLAALEFLVNQTNIEGGAGANFIVEWGAKESCNTPIIEAIMVGDEGISFVRSSFPINK